METRYRGRRTSHRVRWCTQGGALELALVRVDEVARRSGAPARFDLDPSWLADRVTLARGGDPATPTGS